MNMVDKGSRVSGRKMFWSIQEPPLRYDVDAQRAPEGRVADGIAARVDFAVQFSCMDMDLLLAFVGVVTFVEWPSFLGL